MARYHKRKARGVKFGRPSFEKPKEYFELRALWSEGKVSASEAGRRSAVGHILSDLFELGKNIKVATRVFATVPPKIFYILLQKR